MKVPPSAILFFVVSVLSLIGGLSAYSYERTSYDVYLRRGFTFYPYRGIGIHVIGFGLDLGIVGAILSILKRRKGNINWMGATIATLGILLISSGFIHHSCAYTRGYIFIQDDPVRHPYMTRDPRPKDRNIGISMMVVGVALTVIGAVISSEKGPNKGSPKAETTFLKVPCMQASQS